MTQTVEVQKQEVANKKRKGFTLVELGAVLAILAVLMMLIVPRFTAATDNSKITVAEANQRAIVSAVQLYMAGDKNGNYPANMADLIAKGYLAEDPTGKPKGSTYVIDTTTTPATPIVKTELKLGNGDTYTWTYNMDTGVSSSTAPAGASSTP